MGEGRNKVKGYRSGYPDLQACYPDCTDISHDSKVTRFQWKSKRLPSMGLPFQHLSVRGETETIIGVVV